jgi:hypothetical protein
MAGFNLNKLHKVEGKEQYRVEITALEYFEAEVDFQSLRLVCKSYSQTP